VYTAVTRTRSQTLSAALSGLLGFLTIVTGLYFALLRPAMLPEDERLTGVAVATLPPEFAGWLSIVFRTWAGFMIGFGVLLLAAAMYLRTDNSRWIRGGVAASVLIAFSSFLVSNIQLRSDFLWFIATLFTLALLTAIATLMSWNTKRGGV
jgi:hypothetical protein